MRSASLGVALVVVGALAGAKVQAAEPAAADRLPAQERNTRGSVDDVDGGRVTLADLAQADESMIIRSRRAEILARQSNPYLGDLFAAGMLAENGRIAVLIDDPFKNSFAFDGAFQDGGEQFFTDAPTSVGAFFESISGPTGDVFQVTIAAVTDDGSDWLPSGLTIPQFPGQPFTLIRMDMGMFAADFFGALGADAPIQAPPGTMIEALSAGFALFNQDGFLGVAPLAFASVTNQLAGVGAVAGASGAGINECQMLFIVRVTSPLVCPEDVSLTLWPPNHQFHAIDLAEVTGLTGPGGQAVSFSITSITQDEPIGMHGPDAEIIGEGVAMIRAERAGWGNGRVYTINYAASGGGGACNGVVRVSVAHDQSGREAVDDGQDFDSTLASVAGDVSGDGQVDGEDIAIMLAQWRDEAPLIGAPVFTADLNEDGRVNAVDLAALLAGFGLR